MATFSYRGRDQQGKLVDGFVEADDAKAAAEKLLAKAITPVDITLKRTENNFIPKRLTISFMPAVKLDDMIIFCRQAQTLLKAGIPLFDALRRISQTTQSKRLKLTLTEVTKSIAQGQTLSASLRRYPKVFSPIFCSIIDAGESGGKLDMAFSQLAGYISLELETKKRIKSATRYPIFVICFVISAMLIVNFLVIPSFQSMYDNFDTQLPLPTQVIIATSKFLTGYWYIMVIALLALFIATRRVTQTPRGGYIWDRMKLAVPIMGSLLKRIVLARFARTLTMMVRAGVPIVDGLNLVAHATGNRYILFYLSRACNDVKRGTSIARAIADSQLFTPLVLQMLEVGEQSSRIDDMMEEVADFYESEIDYDLSRLGDLIEPVLLLFVAGLVLMLMMAVFLPMWDMVSFVKS